MSAFDVLEKDLFGLINETKKKWPHIKDVSWISWLKKINYSLLVNEDEIDLFYIGRWVKIWWINYGKDGEWKAGWSLECKETTQFDEFQ